MAPSSIPIVHALQPVRENRNTTTPSPSHQTPNSQCTPVNTNNTGLPDTPKNEQRIQIPPSHHRSLQQVLTRRDNLWFVCRMIGKLSTEYQKNITSRAVCQFPELFRGSLHENIHKSHLCFSISDAILQVLTSNGSRGKVKYQLSVSLSGLCVRILYSITHTFSILLPRLS